MSKGGNIYDLWIRVGFGFNFGLGFGFGGLGSEGEGHCGKCGRGINLAEGRKKKEGGRGGEGKVR